MFLFFLISSYFFSSVYLHQSPKRTRALALASVSNTDVVAGDIRVYQPASQQPARIENTGVFVV